MKIAFDIKEAGAPIPVGYTQARCHMVFDVKQGTLQRKSRYVCDGSRVQTPEEVPTYASVVSRDSVRLAFTIAALNDLDVLAADCEGCLLYTSPSPRDLSTSRMPSSA